MYKHILLLHFIFSFLFAQVVVEVDDIVFTEKDFFRMYPKNEWVGGDSTKQVQFFQDFLKHELSVLEVEDLGLSNNPEVFTKIFDRSNHLLINKSYEAFVADPLISEDVLEKTRKHVGRDIFVKHILVGYSGCRLREPLSRTQDEAFLLSKKIKKQLSEGVEKFAVLASKNSNDPSLAQNGGVVGWLSWGQTIPEFQDVAFSLGLNVVSDPVLTGFGYHIILITDEKPSVYADFSTSELEEVVLEKSRGSVYSQLKYEAQVYDSLQIIKNDVVFDEGVLEVLLEVLNNKYNLKKTSFGSSDYVNILQEVEGVGVLCVVNGKGYGPRWFSNKLSRVPSTRRPQINNTEDLRRTFSIVLLQDFAIKMAVGGGILDLASYHKELRSVKYTVYYDAYLKYLVSSVEKPTLKEVLDYYKKHENEKYMIPEKVVVSEIRSKNKQFVDSLNIVLLGGGDFDVVFELSKPSSRVLEPFARGKFNSLGDFAFSSSPGDVSGVIENLNKTFSIARVDSVVAPVPMGIERAQSRVESLLLKQRQTGAKDGVLSGLLKRHNIVVNTDFYRFPLN